MRLMLIGTTGCGKTTLSQKLNRLKVEYKKTQMVGYEGNVIDTPGEYIECKTFYRALNVISMEADIIALVQSSLEQTSLFPPNFSNMFNNKKIIGIITKIDLNNNVKTIENSLYNAGVEKIYKSELNDTDDLNRLIALIKE